MPTLHHIYDPLCGWCYAAAPLIEAARQMPGLTIALHAGGMLIGERRKIITPQWREYVLPHDKRIAKITGQPFGERYFEGLLRDTNAVMDSEPPTTAILAAEALAGRGLDMLHALQRAHYVDGQRIAERSTLTAIATTLGLEAEAFSKHVDALTGAPTMQHILESRALLAQVGGQGFPTMAFENEIGDLVMLDVGSYLGQADAWRQHLKSRVQP